MIYLYNSLTQKKEPLNVSKITIYNCGPTVYDYAHIGNIRPLITFDVLFKYLKFIGKDVKYALNITDVDDKIIKKAAQENKSEKQISEFFTKAYFSLFNKLNVSKQTFNPLVTKNIKGIIEYVNKLVKKGAGYVGKNGDVYFSIDSVKDKYCQLSKQNIEELLSSARKEIDNKYKKNPLDFVLWKKTNEGVNWKSPWNDHGRPGWHTECSYFINKYFGDSISIHGGGIDLKFPHHENERAQNYALTGKEMAKIWMHVGHIFINNEKMSKSLNNFVLPKDILKEFSGNDIRWFFMQTKYENPINYTKNLMEQAKNEIDKLFKILTLSIVTLKMNNISFKYKKTKLDKGFVEYVEDDLNFPNMIKYINELFKKLSQLLREKKFKEAVITLNQILNEFFVIGIVYKYDTKNDKFASEWKKALDSKNYKLADQIREKIK